MALKKQKVGVTFAKGVDEVTATKLIVPGSMTTMQNGVYNKVGEISKRNGYDDLNVDVDVNFPSTLDAPYDGPLILGGESSGVLDDELLLFDGDRMFSRSPQDASWTFKDLATPVNTRSSRVVWGQSTTGSGTRSAFERFVEAQHAYQCVYLNGYYLYMWADGDITIPPLVAGRTAVVYYSLVDAVTGEHLVNSQQFGASFVAYRIVTSGDRIFVVYTEHGNPSISSRSLDTTNVELRNLFTGQVFLTDSGGAVITDVDPNYKFLDAHEVDANEFVLSYAREVAQVAGYVRTMRLSNAATPVTLAELDVVRTTIGHELRCLSVYRDAVDGNIAVAWVQQKGVAPAFAEYVQLVVWDALLTAGAPGPWPVYGGLTAAGYEGVTINLEENLLPSAAASCRHVSVGPGQSDSFYSVVWDTNLEVDDPFDAGYGTWDSPYLACESKVVIRQCARFFITTQADYDIYGAANGIVEQLPTSSASVNAGNSGFHPNVYYASLASRQVLKGDGVYFSVVQPTQRAQKMPTSTGSTGFDPYELYHFPVEAIQDGIQSSSYSVMRFSRVPVASTEGFSGRFNKYTQFSTLSCVGKLAPSIAGGVHTQAAVSRMSEVVDGSDAWVFAGGEVALIRSDQDEASRNVRMTSQCIVDFGTLQDRYESAQPNKARLTCGGVASTYDGAQFTPPGWVFPPEIVWSNYNLSLDSRDTQPGWPAPGIDPTYFHKIGVRAVYEWYDNQGQRHQSAPSQEFVIWHYPTADWRSTTLGPIAGDEIQILVNIYGWLPKDTRVVFYWTKLDQQGLGPYYRSVSQVGTLAAPSTDEDQKQGLKALPCRTLENTVVTVGPVQVVAEQQRGTVLLSTDFGTIMGETASGSYWGQVNDPGRARLEPPIFRNEILYTNGDVLVNDDAPSSRCIAEWNGRVWLGGLEVQNEIAFSKTTFPNEGIFFNDALRLTVGSELTRVVALEAMDDKLVVFKEDGIFVVYGEGPNDLGQGASYRVQLVSSDIGCLGPKSVVFTDTGIMFQSDAGIYRLSRGLKLDFVGARIEDTTLGASVHGAELVPAKTQVRFMLSTGTSAVYDYLTDAWYEFLNQASCAGGACVLWKGNLSFLNAGGAMKVQNAGYLDDAAAGTGVYVPTTIETAWIKTGDVEGLQRVYKLLVIGSKPSGHNLTVQVGFDYDEAYTDTKTWTAAELAALPRYQVEIRPSRQRCQAIRLKMSDSGTPPSEAQGYVMTYLMLEVGIQDGLYRRFAASVGRK